MREEVPPEREEGEGARRRLAQGGRGGHAGEGGRACVGGVAGVGGKGGVDKRGGRAWEGERACVGGVAGVGGKGEWIREEDGPGRENGRVNGGRERESG